MLNTNLVLIALKEFGVRETLGSHNSPRIEKYFSETNFKLTTEETDHWCGIFMLWCLLKSGYERPSFNCARARNWLSIGENVSYGNEQLGDIIILWRGRIDSDTGHVGIYINRDLSTKSINILGGNQGNAVCIKAFSEDMMLGTRRLLK
jgi:uncharacterized protein (TIGR02594 family)